MKTTGILSALFFIFIQINAFAQEDINAQMLEYKTGIPVKRLSDHNNQDGETRYLKISNDSLRHMALDSISRKSRPWGYRCDIAVELFEKDTTMEKRAVGNSVDVQKNSNK